GRKLVHAKNGDDVLQVLVALQHALDAARGVIVLLADNVRGESARIRRERVHRGVNAQFGDGTLQHDGRVQVRDGGGGGGVGQVVGGHVNGLKTRDGPFGGRGNALLEVAHFGPESGLVTDGTRSAAQQRGDLRAGLRKAENVVDKEQHILLFFVAEIFGHGEGREGDAEAGPGRLVHLAIDQTDAGAGLQNGKP